MRVVLIATIIALSPLTVCAQSRPAPDTPGESAVIEEEPVGLNVPSMVGALRVLVITSGIIGGFVAADVFSGGALTAPLLMGTSELISHGNGLRPVIAGLPTRLGAATSPAFESAVARRIAATPMGVRPNPASMGLLAR